MIFFSGEFSSLCDTYPYLNFKSHPVWVPKMAKGPSQVTFNAIKVKTIWFPSSILAHCRTTAWQKFLLLIFQQMKVQLGNTYSPVYCTVNDWSLGCTVVCQCAGTPEGKQMFLTYNKLNIMALTVVQCTFSKPKSIAKRPISFSFWSSFPSCHLAIVY